MASSVEPGTLYFWGSSREGSAALLQVADGAQVRAMDGPPIGSGPAAAVLADEGIAWVTLAAQDGAMDDQEEATDAASASRLATAAEAVSIARGERHTLILSSDGSVFASGSNSFGQCGLGHLRDLSLPKQVVTLGGHPVKMVACGDEHSAFVTTDGCLYTCGRGSEGQLGLACSSDKGAAVGESLGSVAAPRFVSALDGVPVATVACGCRFTVVVLLDGALLAMGEGRCGQLGIGRVCAARGRPSLVARGGADRSPFVNAAAGWAHALAITESGHVYSWGDNSRGQLGHGDTSRRVIPTRIEDGTTATTIGTAAGGGEGGGGERGGEFKEAEEEGLAFAGSCQPIQVVAAAAGQFHSAAVTPQGVLLTWGASLAGQLGHSAGLKPSVDVVMPATGESGASAPQSRMDMQSHSSVSDRASPAVQALAAQLPSLDSPPPGSRHGSRPGSRQHGVHHHHHDDAPQGLGDSAGSPGVSISAGLAGRSPPRDEMGMGRFAGDTDGATRGIVTPYRRFRERLAREDGGRAGRDAPPAHIVATHAINVAALRRLPGLESTLQTALAGTSARHGTTEAQAALAAKAAGRKAAQAVLRAEPHDEGAGAAASSAHDDVVAAAAEAEAAAAAAVLAQTAVGGVPPDTGAGAGDWAGWSGGLDLLQDQDTAAAALSASVGRSPTLRARAAREAAAAAWASSRPRLDRESAPPVGIPTQVALPELNGRIVTRVACGSHSTVVFAPAVVSSCSPRMGWARGGHWLAIIGPGLASLTCASRRLTGASLGLGPDLLLPVAEEDGVGCRVRGVVARLTRPGHIDEEALAGRLDDPSPDEVAAFDPAEDAARAAAEPLVCFAPVYEALPRSKFALLAAEADARLAQSDGSRGPRYGLQPDVLVIRAPRFPGTCDIMVELLSRDRTVPDALEAEAAAETEAQEAGIDTAQGAGFVAGGGAAALSAQSEWAANTAAAGVWAVCRGAATGSVVEQPVLHTAVPDAVVLPAGGAVAISGSGLMGMLQKDPSARDAVDALMAEVDSALQQQEDQETEATASNAETLGMKDDEIEVHQISKTGNQAAPAGAETSLHATRMFGAADQPVTTAVRWIVTVGGEVRTVTEAQPCWWQCDFRETDESGGTSAVAGGSVSSASSLGAASHALLSGRGGGGEEADGDAEQGVFDAKLHATVPPMTAADLGLVPGESAAEAVVELQPELSPNGSEWIPCPGISLTGVLPTLQSVSSPATVPMAQELGASSPPCALTVAGSGFVDTGAVVARLIVAAASSEEAVGIVTDPVPLRVRSSLQMVAPRGMYDALEAAGAVPRGGWAAVRAEVSFDGGARFLPVAPRRHDWHAVVVDAEATLAVPTLVAVEGGELAVALKAPSEWLSAPGLADGDAVIGCAVSWSGVDEPMWLPATAAADEAASLVVRVPSVAEAAPAQLGGTLTAQLTLAGCPMAGVVGRGETHPPASARLFAASRLVIAGVGPKKIGPGAKIDISLKGLALAKLAIEQLKEHKAAVWVSTGADQSPGMAAEGQGLLLQAVVEAPESWTPDQDDADAAVSIRATLPALAAGLVPGEQAMSVSLDDGHTWSQLGSVKIGKK